MAGSELDLRDGGTYAFIVLAWGLNYLVVRELLPYGGALWLAAGRAAVGGAAAGGWLLLPGVRGHLDARGKRDAVLLGTVNTGAFFGIWFVAAASVPPGEAAVLIYTFPLHVALLAVPLLHHRVGRLEAGALALGLGGVALVAQPWSAGRLDPTAVVELLVAAFCWALGTVLYQRRFRGPELREGNAYQLLGGALALLAAAAWAEPGSLPSSSPALLVDLLYLGVIGTALAYTAWFSMLSRVPAGVLSTYTFLVPVVSLALSAGFTGERLDPTQAAGVALVVGAIYLIGRARSRGAAPPSPRRAGS